MPDSTPSANTNPQPNLNSPFGQNAQALATKLTELTEAVRAQAKTGADGQELPAALAVLDWTNTAANDGWTVTPMSSPLGETDLPELAHPYYEISKDNTYCIALLGMTDPDLVPVAPDSYNAHRETYIALDGPCINYGASSAIIENATE